MGRLLREPSQRDVQAYAISREFSKITTGGANKIIGHFSVVECDRFWLDRDTDLFVEEFWNGELTPSSEGAFSLGGVSIRNILDEVKDDRAPRWIAL
jgi:hypothetical protein